LELNSTSPVLDHPLRSKEISDHCSVQEEEEENDKEIRRAKRRRNRFNLEFLAKCKKLG
jgi:hypothetical protein